MKIHLQTEIDQLKRDLNHLSTMVEESYALAIGAAVVGEAQTLREVTKRDKKIDRLEVEFEEDCLKVLALHQPVATDLRFLVAMLKANNDLERVGDLAVNIAGCNACQRGEPMPEEIGRAFRQMGSESQTMLRMALNSLMSMEVTIAREVLTLDDAVDADYHSLSKKIKSQIKSNVDHSGSYVSWLMAAKSVERVADHATNIAEDTIYTTDGEIIRHGFHGSEV